MSEESDSKMKLTNTISSTGIFLQYLVMKELRNWHTEIEYPVQISPFFQVPRKNPLAVGLNQTYKWDPKSLIEHFNSYQIQNEREETRIDVVANFEHRIDSPLKRVGFKLCIECKKLDPDYSTWIFFKKHEGEGTMNLISKKNKSEGFATLSEIPETTTMNNKIYLQLMNKWNLKPIRHLLCDSSVAVNQKENDQGRKNKEYFKRDFDKIDSAARQIVKGTYGYILDDLKNQIKGDGDEYGIRNVIYFPIVVTTADLLIGNFNENEIDRKDGFLKKELQLDKVDSLIYEVGAPKSVRFPTHDLINLDLETRRTISKWQVLILSVSGFIQFLKDLEEEADLFHLEE